MISRVTRHHYNLRLLRGPQGLEVAENAQWRHEDSGFSGRRKVLIRRGVSDYCPPAVPLLPAPGRAAARSCLLPALLTVPALEEQPHAFRDGRAARGPTIHCADIHGQPVSELALGQADAPQGATELSRGRRHAASIPGLVRRALCRHYAYTYRKSVSWVVAADDAPANFWASASEAALRDVPRRAIRAAVCEGRRQTCSAYRRRDRLAFSRRRAGMRNA